MNVKEIQEEANQLNLGKVVFETRIAINTGKQFEAGYVYSNKKRVLFCKRQPSSAPDDFYLCNEFRRKEED